MNLGEVNASIKKLTDMMEKAQEVFIDSVDGLLKITFLFHVYDKTKIADYSDEIKKLAAQIYSPQYLKHLNLDDDEDFI